MNQAETMQFCREYYAAHKAEIDTLFQWQESSMINMITARRELGRAFLIPQGDAIAIWDTWKKYYDGFKLLYRESKNAQTS